MHRYEDYRTTYMAKKGLGGGPVLNLQIHCLDYLQWLFGSLQSVYSVMGEGKNLEIDVEASVSSLYILQDKTGRDIPVHAASDFYQYPPVHRLKAVGETGYIEADLNLAQTRWVSGDSAIQTISHGDFQRNEMFLEELRDFLRCIKERKAPECDAAQGVISLKMALAARESAKTKQIVTLKGDIQ